MKGEDVLILGVDPGNAVTGYGIVEYKDRRCRLIDCGCVRTHAKLPSAQRLKKIYTPLEKCDKILLAVFPFLRRYCWNIVIYAEA